MFVCCVSLAEILRPFDMLAKKSNDSRQHDPDIQRVIPIVMQLKDKI